MKIEYIKLKHLESAIVTVDKVRDVGYGEIVTITSEGKTYTGEVMAIEDDLAMVQVFGDTTGMTVDNAVVTFEGRPLSLPLNASILGRVFDGLGNPIDGGLSLIHI